MQQYRFDKNNYAFNTSSKLGVYIIHGFSSTTYEVKKLAKFLSDQGYYTVANNLPGHGTNIDECNRIPFVQWLDAVKKDLAILSSKCEKLFVIGNSMGGVLSLYLSSLFPLNGFVVGGAVLKFNNPFTTNFIIPVICNIVKKKRKSKFNKSKNIKFYGYKEYPLVALNQYRKMNKFVLPLLKKISAPGLIIHSYADSMSIKENVNIINNTINSKEVETFYVKRAHHNMFDDNPDQKIIFQKILKFLNNH